MRELLSLLPKPSRYIGIEEGAIHKSSSKTTLRVALAFPDMYEVGMSYLGQKILYGIINAHPSWWAERVYTPCRDAGVILSSHDVSLATLESDTPLSELDAVGFSITHELCYTNVLYMMDLGKIPLRAEQRDVPKPDGRRWPIVMAGGGCTLEAEPLAPFMDLMMLGEGERVLPEVLRLLEKMPKASRKEFLFEAKNISGVYVPEFFYPDQAGENFLTPIYSDYSSVTRRVVPDLDIVPYPKQQPIPFGAVHNRLALEIARGCTRGCRFCQAGVIYRPARERSVPNLKKLLDSCLSTTGFDDVSFLSLSTGDFSALKELFMDTVDRCSAEQISVSLPSLRVGSIDDAIMEKISGIRRTGATLAPEAGSQRLRNVINKGITEEELILHMQKLFEHGWQQVKLYFMIGLPTETDEDLLAIIDLCRKARDAAGPGIKRMQITAAVSPFVPKAHTPFQWHEQISLEEIRRRVGVLLDSVKGEKRIKLRWHEPEMSVLEGLLSRGDRKLANVIESAYRKGAIFSSWMEGFSLSPWKEALQEYNLSFEEYTRSRKIGEALPWDHLQSGIDNKFFIQEWERALQEKTVKDCRYHGCLQCGVCDTTKNKSLLDKPFSENIHFQDNIKKADNSEEKSYKYSNILNRMQRDQAAHSVQLDQYGRVILRQNGEVKEGKPETKNLPSALPEHLTRKISHLRIWYARSGAAIYLSQLEVQSIFERALRRASLPLSFSQGFHPMPLVSFGRALPVGVASECEWFSVYLSEKRDQEKVFHRVNRGLPCGMRLTAVEEIDLKIKGVDALREVYRVEYFGATYTSESIQKMWKNVLEAETIPWKRETKKGTKTLDARSFITEIAVHDEFCFIKFDWSNRYVSPLAVCLATLSGVGGDINLADIKLTKIAQEGL